MRKLTPLLLFTLPMLAQSPQATWILTAAGATSTIQPSETYSRRIPCNHTLQVVVTGTATACSVRLEGSLDGSNWFDLSGAQDCTATNPSGAKGVMFHVDGKPETYIRANLTAFTGATSAAISYVGTP